MTFNDKVDLFMQNNNIKTLKQLAEVSETPYTTLRDLYEKQSADNSRLSTIRKLSTYMKCTMDYLAYNDIENPNQTRRDANNDNSFVNQYKILFDKDSVLTAEQKNFMLNFIKEQHEKIDKRLNEGD